MEYNVISSNCIGGYYFKETETTPKNPFIWTSIKLSNFITLIENYDNIDFTNISAKLTNGEFMSNINKTNIPRLVLDDKVNVYFEHHHYSPRTRRPLGNNIYSPIIVPLICRKWRERVAEKDDAAPRVFSYWDCEECTDTDIMWFIELKDKYKDYIFVLFSKDDYSQYECDNFIYIPRSNEMTVSMHGSELVNRLRERDGEN